MAFDEFLPVYGFVDINPATANIIPTAAKQRVNVNLKDDSSVGAASSRDRLFSAEAFIAAGSRSHRKRKLKKLLNHPYQWESLTNKG